jgi:hypothetical protein
MPGLGARERGHAGCACVYAEPERGGSAQQVVTEQSWGPQWCQTEKAYQQMNRLDLGKPGLLMATTPLDQDPTRRQGPWVQRTSLGQ